MIPAVLAEGRISLLALRNALEHCLGINLASRRHEIRKCAELYVEKLASAHDSPLTHEAPPIACSTPMDSDRGWMMFTQWPDEMGFCNAWAGTWEPLVDQHSRSVMGSDRIECTFNMDLTSFIIGLCGCFI